VWQLINISSLTKKQKLLYKCVVYLRLGSTLFLTLHDVLAFSCPVPGRVMYSRNLDLHSVEMYVGAFPGGSLSIFKFVCKMRGLFNKIFFNDASRLLKDVSLKCFQRYVFKVFYPKFSVHKVIISVSLVYLFSVYLSMWWTGLIKLTLRMSKETGFISLLWRLLCPCLWLPTLWLPCYKSLATMYVKEFKNL
jgi:hypothetical protein